MALAARKIAVERQWDVTLGGMLYGHARDNSEQRWSVSPDYGSYDVKSAELGEQSTVGVLLGQLAKVDFDSIRRFGCPFFVFAGVEDRTTSAPLAEELYNRVEAPQKKLFKMERAAHYPFLERPGEFLLDLVRDIHPLAEQDVSAGTH